MCDWECGTWDPAVSSSFDSLLRHQSTYNVISWYDPHARWNQILMFLTTKWKWKWQNFSGGLPTPRHPNPPSAAPKKHIIPLKKSLVDVAPGSPAWHEDPQNHEAFTAAACIDAGIPSITRDSLEQVLDLLIAMLCCECRGRSLNLSGLFSATMCSLGATLTGLRGLGGEAH